MLMTIVMAQAPQSFKYQAIARNSSGDLIQNQLVAFRISILQGGPSGTLLYNERHTLTTNDYGLANLDIGSGVVLSGVFNNINWAAGQMFMKVELDPTGGTAYLNMGTSELLSVPYALFAETSGELELPYSGTISSTQHALSITNNGTGYGIFGSAPGIGIKGVGTALTGSSYGIYGLSNSEYGYGVYGKATYITGSGRGVYGETDAMSGYGVKGWATSTTGTNYGVHGQTSSNNGTGVHGYSSSLTGSTFGTRGTVASSAGTGVYGWASSTTGETMGIRGHVASPDGYSGYFTGGKFYVDGSVGIGTTSPSQDLSVYGYSLSFANFITSATGSASTDGLMIGTGGGYAYLINHESSTLVIGTNNQYNNLILQPNGDIGIGTATPSYLLDVAGTVNLNKGIASGIALRCYNDEALWYNNTYFSWGYGGTYNFIGNKLKIAGNGNVAPSYQLYVDGNAAKSLGGSTWIVSSDLSLKNLTGNYDKGLQEINALQAVKFYYKEGNPRDLPSDQEQIGFVAQEVQKVFPEAVNVGEDSLLDFNMHPINVALINAIKELKAENDRLKAENEKINERLGNIEALLSIQTENK